MSKSKLKTMAKMPNSATAALRWPELSGQPLFNE
jgi:hypothetical protein